MGMTVTAQALAGACVVETVAVGSSSTAAAPAIKNNKNVRRAILPASREQNKEVVFCSFALACLSHSQTFSSWRAAGGRVRWTLLLCPTDACRYERHCRDSSSCCRGGFRCRCSTTQPCQCWCWWWGRWWSWGRPAEEEVHWAAHGQETQGTGKRRRTGSCRRRPRCDGEAG